MRKTQGFSGGNEQVIPKVWTPSYVKRKVATRPAKTRNGSKDTYNITIHFFSQKNEYYGINVKKDANLITNNCSSCHASDLGGFHLPEVLIQTGRFEIEHVHSTSRRMLDLKGYFRECFGFPKRLDF